MDIHCFFYAFVVYLTSMLEMRDYMNQKQKGILCIISAAFFFALMSLFIRLAGDLPVFQKSFFRNLVALAFALIVLKKSQINVSLDKGDWKGLLLRSIFGTIGVLFNFYAVDHLLLADATILNKLSPFFAVIMGVVILKESIRPFQLGTVIVALLGAMLVVKPGASIVAGPAIIGLLGGCAAGTAYTFVRLLGKRGVPGPFIVFFFSAFSCITIGPMMMLDYVPMSAQQLLFLLLAGLSAAIAQFSITSAYCYAPAKEISVFDYSQIIFSAILGFLVFHQIPDYLSWIGYALILLTAIANFIYNNRKQEPR